jgi:hypothetical protein
MTLKKVRRSWLRNIGNGGDVAHWSKKKTGKLGVGKIGKCEKGGKGQVRII